MLGKSVEIPLKTANHRYNRFEIVTANGKKRIKQFINDLIITRGLEKNLRNIIESLCYPNLNEKEMKSSTYAPFIHSLTPPIAIDKTQHVVTFSDVNLNYNKYAF